MKMPEQFWMVVVFVCLFIMAYIFATNPYAQTYFIGVATMNPLGSAIFALVLVSFIWKLYEHFKKKAADQGVKT